MKSVRGNSSTWHIFPINHQNHEDDDENHDEDNDEAMMMITIIPCTKDIGMTNNPKDEEFSFKNRKNMSTSFFEEIFDFTKIHQVNKGSCGSLRPPSPHDL